MIRVIDKWVIDTDGKCYVGGKLETRTIKDKDDNPVTEEYIKQPFYHTTFLGCVKAISARMRMEAIKRTDGDLEAAIQAIQRADKRLTKALGVFEEIEVVNKR